MEKARSEGCTVIYLCDSHDKDDREFEIFLKGFPEGYRWGILAGIEETIRLLSDIDKISKREKMLSVNLNS